MTEADPSTSSSNADGQSSLSNTRLHCLQVDAAAVPQTQANGDKFDLFKLLGKPKGTSIANCTDNIIYMTEKDVCMRLADDPIKSARLASKSRLQYVQLAGLLNLAGYKYHTPSAEIPKDVFRELEQRYCIFQSEEPAEQLYVDILHVDKAEKLSRDLGIYETCRQFFHAVRNRARTYIPLRCGTCRQRWDRWTTSFCFWSQVHCKHGRNIPFKDLVFRICKCNLAFVTIDDFKAHLAEEECFNFDG
ncbi:hypothetical protein IWZ01DRAFT_485849 [Phyllosticta capitalensis]